MKKIEKVLPFILMISGFLLLLVYEFSLPLHVKIGIIDMKEFLSYYIPGVLLTVIGLVLNLRKSNNKSFIKLFPLVIYVNFLCMFVYVSKFSLNTGSNSPILLRAFYAGESMQSSLLLMKNKTFKFGSFGDVLINGYSIGTYITSKDTVIFDRNYPYFPHRLLIINNKMYSPKNLKGDIDTLNTISLDVVENRLGN